MRAAILRELGEPLTIEDVEVDSPGRNEVVLRTVAAGVCHSDLHYMEGLYATELPVIPGHESAGVVEAVGADVTYVRPGDHVITCMSAACGRCRLCVTARQHLCRAGIAERPAGSPSRYRQGSVGINQLFRLGSYADRMLVHEATVVKIRPDMPLDRAALIGCAVMTGFGAVNNTAKVEMGSTVAVIGCGGVGLSAVLGAVAAGASRIIAVDIVEEKLALAGRFGATDLVNGTATDTVDAVLELTDGEGVDYAFEALGLKETAENAFRMLAVGGEAVIVGLVPQGETIEIEASSLVYERVIRGCDMGSNRFRIDMPYLVDRYMSGLLPLDDLVSKRVGLDDINAAFDDMKAGTVARSVIVFE